MDTLTVTAADHDLIWRHLLQDHGEEEAAFLFATERDGFTPVHCVLVPRTGFAYKSRFGFELADSFRASMIKEAHDRQALLVELHSHPFPSPACFSPTDIAGLREFVPHVRWRLKGKPYAAIVVAPTSFDALTWRANDGPEPLALNVEGTILLPTRRSLKEWDDAQL